MRSRLLALSATVLMGLALAFILAISASAQRSAVNRPDSDGTLFYGEYELSSEEDTAAPSDASQNQAGNILQAASANILYVATTCNDILNDCLASAHLVGR